jgi:hypothetical protein
MTFSSGSYARSRGHVYSTPRTTNHSLRSLDALGAMKCRRQRYVDFRQSMKFMPCQQGPQDVFTGPDALPTENVCSTPRTTARSRRPVDALSADAEGTSTFRQSTEFMALRAGCHKLFCCGSYALPADHACSIGHTVDRSPRLVNAVSLIERRRRARVDFVWCWLFCSFVQIYAGRRGPCGD